MIILSNRFYLCFQTDKEHEDLRPLVLDKFKRVTKRAYCTRSCDKGIQYLHDLYTDANLGVSLGHLLNIADLITKEEKKKLKELRKAIQKEIKKLGGREPDEDDLGVYYAETEYTKFEKQVEDRINATGKALI